ncbi:hypothetical protein IFT73_16955 [Aeromicrobium sp. CFBP 8757]|uniref:hypothetical protein n=1 Tax=Aeromicrobium sp. CFBP 8757 TaxID=2775288 RepID=UPI0017825B00|nr:hypothetical protein [Aeromicrobium sp. CFBP 8757]MBD8608547.1 hypothetical protein [Aeromicrobium sp. CFBP 8757]
MSYEAEKKRLIEEFETVVGTIRKDWGLKDKKQTLDAKPSSSSTTPRPAGRH